MANWCGGCNGPCIPISLCMESVLHHAQQINFVQSTEAEPAVPVSRAEMKNVWQEPSLEQTRIYLD